MAALFRDVDLCHHFQAAGQGGPDLAGKYLILDEDSVLPESYEKLILLRLDMDVGGVRGDGVSKHLIDRVDDHVFDQRKRLRLLQAMPVDRFLDFSSACYPNHDIAAIYLLRC